MPPRRSHKKSRAGCRRCKVRKIKCDEVHPRCGNCTKHGVVCDFESNEVADDLASVSTPAAPSPLPPTPAASYARANPQPPRRSPPRPPSVTPRLVFNQPPTPKVSSVTAQVSRLMELRLMHQYTNVTSKTLLTSSPVTEDIWQRAVPQMAFEGRTYLADAILSVAALHLRSQAPEDKSLIRATHAYTASTLAEYCASLEKGITSDNAESLFLTASLIAFQSVASRIFAKDDAEPDDPNARYALPLPWFHSFQGVKTVVATSWQWIRNSNIVKSVIDSQPSLQLDLNPLGPNSFFGHLLEGLDEEIAEEAPDMVPSTTQCYSHAICVLNWAHKSPHPAAALAFPATVARRFIELVEMKRPRALATIACFFALLKRLDGVWWLHDVARREVMGLVGLFESGSKWWRHLEWPVRIALWDGSNIPPEIWGTDWETSVPPDTSQGFVDHIELVAELMGQSTHDLLNVATPFTGEPPLTAESPD
ncbi:uncharacterized protein F5Z01DRAFT_77567 [Emericellopsis atlantica]|uniref:Zn(2)-C6 fungal-type domain-containing protein n=1 Tax=Emericellopsis atlantica TaxID=2614577 RepID=A0A9P7ZNG0_9HYPO|nr:uncharacterized protein F5Z01DRAFT_77567 [Emericellopsis atlantica]KAG9255161.1 hypothetical protein F5Z01DRAFT_77567 [Emericellopsis atlantica]